MKIYLIAISILFLTFHCYSQGLRVNSQLPVNIDANGSSPDQSAMLDVKSTSKGVLIPRMTSSQRNSISSPAIGLLVFDTSTKSFWFYNSTAWINLSIPSKISDKDSDTTIETERFPDEDFIRFKVGGVDRWEMRGSRLQPLNTGNSVFVGLFAGLNDDLSNNENVGIGYLALGANTTGALNTVTGHEALGANTTGVLNTAIGHQALTANTTGTFNTATGSQALAANINGSDNSAFGFDALLNNTIGDENTALGSRALRINETGSRNTAGGVYSLLDNKTGSNNTALGYWSLVGNTTGNYNTAVGVSTLNYSTAGSYNTAIGYQAYYMSSGPTTSYNNSTAIGYNAQITTSNQIRIGNMNVTSIGGYTNWTNISDQRFKSNIKENVKGLEFIKALRPVTYTLNQDSITSFFKQITIFMGYAMHLLRYLW